MNVQIIVRIRVCQCLKRYILEEDIPVLCRKGIIQFDIFTDNQGRIPEGCRNLNAVFLRIRNDHPRIILSVFKEVIMYRPRYLAIIHGVALRDRDILDHVSPFVTIEYSYQPIGVILIIFVANIQIVFIVSDARYLSVITAPRHK